MGFAPLVLGIVGAATSAAAAISAGDAQSAQARYQAQVAKNNAQIAQQNAEYSSQAGEAQALNTGLKGAARVAHVKAAEAANNLDVNSGSPVAVRAGEAETAKLDTMTTRNNALLQAYGYQTQGANYTSQAGLDESVAANAPIGADLSAAGGLLGSASSLGFKWSGMQESGNTTEGFAYQPGAAVSIK